MENSALKNYLENTLLIKVNDFFAVKISTQLKDSLSYIFDEAINAMGKIALNLANLNIKYPNLKNPKFYAYIVPNENFKEYLDFPEQFNVKGGGKPVECFEEDGFNCAYGMSVNMLQGFVNPPMHRHINHIHEFAHLIQSEFFMNRILGEGFADAFCFYTLGFEDKFLPFNQTICQLKNDDIFSVKQLMEFQKNGSFDFKRGTSQYNMCSFRLSYISSYLFVRACLEKIEKIYKCNRFQATQKFLDIMFEIKSFGFNMFCELSDKLGFDKDILINTNQEQLKIIEKIKLLNKENNGKSFENEVAKHYTSL